MSFWATCSLGLLLLCLQLAGCVSSEEIERQKQEQAEQRDANVASVRKELQGYQERGRFMTFRLRASRELEPIIFDYLSKLGGTLTTSGGAEFEIDVDSDRSNTCPGPIHYKNEMWFYVAVKIYDLQGLGGSRNLILVGEAADCYNRNYREAALRYLTDQALYSMRF